MSKQVQYATQRINLLMEEMGTIKGVFTGNGTLFIEFENGMNLQLHEHEIRHQAIEHLQCELEGIKES